MKDIATKAGVDRSIVSRVLSDDPELSIRPDTRRRIAALALELGYQPNAAARALRLSRSYALGLILPDLRNPVYDPIVRGAQRRAEQRNHTIVVGSARSETIDRTFIDLLQQGRVDGLMVASSTADGRWLDGRATENRRIIFLHRRAPGVSGSVSMDDAAGARLATGYLRELGHRRLGHVAGPEYAEPSHRRRAGFASAAKGLKSHVVAAAGTEAEDGFAATVQLLSEAPETSAIFVASLRAAIGVIAAAFHLGRQVPGTLSVIAMLDDPIAAYLRPALTTVSMPMEELGEVGVEQILAKINGQPVRQTIVRTAPRLIVRGSCAPPPD